MVISLAQKQEERKKEHAIGFKVYRCQKGETNLSESFMRNNNSVGTFFFLHIYSPEGDADNIFVCSKL